MLQKILTGVLWILLPSILSAAEPQALFNGTSLAGWTFDVFDPAGKPEAIWYVSDGLLVCKGRPAGVIRTEKEFSNYELSVEWRWAPGTTPGNSGVLVHTSTPRELYGWPKSIEIQLGNGDAGDFWTIGESLTAAGPVSEGRRWKKLQASTENKPGEWNALRIRCEDDNVTVWVNGTLMNEGTRLSTTRGAICLQSEGGEIHFRKVELTPIR